MSLKKLPSLLESFLCAESERDSANSLSSLRALWLSSCPSQVDVQDLCNASITGLPAEALSVLSVIELDLVKCGAREPLAMTRRWRLHLISTAELEMGSTTAGTPNRPRKRRITEQVRLAISAPLTICSPHSSHHCPRRSSLTYAACWMYIHK